MKRRLPDVWDGESDRRQRIRGKTAYCLVEGNVHPTAAGRVPALVRREHDAVRPGLA